MRRFLGLATLAALVGGVWTMGRAEAADGAAPATGTPLFYSGTLTDDCGVAKDGPVHLTLVFSSAASGGVPCAVDAPAAPLIRGRFRVDVEACAAQLAAWPTAFVSTTVNGTALGPARPVGAVPSARVASAADGGLRAELDALTARLTQLEAALPVTWPAGSYCVFRSNGVCPAGFQSERMEMPAVQADMAPLAGQQSIANDSTTYCVQGGCTGEGVDGHLKVRHVIYACCK